MPRYKDRAESPRQFNDYDILKIVDRIVGRMELNLKLPPDIWLRPAAPEDFAFAEKLYFESTGRLLRALGTWDEVAVKKRFAKAFHRTPSQIICVDGNEVGWLQLSLKDKSLHLHQVHLLRSHRNRGIGSRLIRAIMGQAKVLRLPLTLKVVRGNPALRLYRRLGFRMVGEDKERLSLCWDDDTCRKSSGGSEG